MTTNVPSNKNIPATAAGVRDKLLKFKQGGPSVEEARQAMLSAREPATTMRHGTKIPTFVEEEATKRNIQSVIATTSNVSRLILEAKNILAKYPLPAGKRYNLNAMRDQGLITQAHIDALLSEGKPQAEPSQELINSITEPEIPETPIVPERTPAMPVVPVVVVEPEAIKPIESEPTKTVLEDNKKYILSYGKEGKEWVVEMAFKNGAGTERWTASTREDLIKQIAKAKANASHKIHEQEENIKDLVLGDVPDNWDWFIEELKDSHGLTIEQFNALPEASKNTIRDTIEFAEAQRFMNSFKEYYPCPENDQHLSQYLASRKLSSSFRNLSLAYKALRRQDILKQQPEEPVRSAPVVSVPVVVPQQVSAPESANSHPTVVAEPVETVPTVAAPATPAPTVRKRVSTGIVPGSSSAAPVVAAERTEEGIAPQEPSVKELRAMSDADLKRIATQGRKYSRY